MSLKSLHAFVIRGKCVFLMSWTGRELGIAAQFPVLCAVGVQSVFSWEPGLSVASLLDGQAVFTVSVSGQGFPQFFLLFSYNLVLPDVLVVVCRTESQDQLAKGTLFWV